MGMFLRRSHFSSLSKRKSTKPLHVYVYSLVGTRFWFKGQVINRVGNFAGFGHKKGKGFGKRAAHPHPIFLGVPPPGPCVHLRWLACDDLRFGSSYCRSNLHASTIQSKFFTVWPPNPSAQGSRRPCINPLLANEIEDSLPFENVFFGTCVYLRGNLRVRLATQRKSLRRKWTCVHLRLLAGPPGL